MLSKKLLQLNGTKLFCSSDINVYHYEPLSLQMVLVLLITQDLCVNLETLNALICYLNNIYYFLLHPIHLVL